MDEVDRQAYAAIVTGDWDTLRPMLYRYPHWTDSQGTLRGRSKVMAMLAHATTAAEPTSIELGRADLSGTPEQQNVAPGRRLQVGI